MDELKPCPFCGTDVKIEYYTVDEPFTCTDFGFEICCHNCGIRVRKHSRCLPGIDKEADKKAKQELLTKWNTRK